MDKELRFYTTDEVAEMFSVTNYTVRDWIREGKLKAVKINGYWRISRDSLEDYANSLLEGR
jgi:putative resolvase